MPDHSSARPIHCTLGPLKVRVALEPRSVDKTALPPLWMVLLFRNHFPEYWIAPLAWSIRVVAGGVSLLTVVFGAKMMSPTDVISMSSIQTQFCCDAGFLVPVTSIVSVWVPR